MKKNKRQIAEDVHDKQSSIIGEALAATIHNDAFSNPGARTGFGQQNLVNTTEYPLTRLTQDWQTLTSLYRSSWIVQRVCSVIPEDAMTSLRMEAPDLDNDEIATLDDCLNITKVRRRIIEAMKWARLYGGAAAIIMTDGEDGDMSQPLNPKKLLPGSFRGLFVVDRWSGIYPSLELVTNKGNPDFGLPRYYEVRDENGVVQYKVHHSRVLRFVGTEMPYYEAMAEQWWGISAVEPMFDDLVRRDNVTHNIANLTFKACLSVYGIEDLDQIFASASASAQRAMYSRIEAMSILESNMGIRLVNKGDEVQQLQYGFSGLPEILDGAMLDVSGSTAIPATRLFGRSPAGMNSTGESDEKNYHATLEQQRSSQIMPALEKLAPVICMSSLGRIPDGIKFKLPPLAEMSPSEKADIVDKQSSYLERLFQAGVLPADSLLKGVRNAQTDVGITTTITDEDVNRMQGKYLKDLTPAQDPFGGVFNGETLETGEEAGQEQPETQESNDEELVNEPDPGTTA